MKKNYENVPGTWASELRQHFNAFSEYCWKGFNLCCEKMRETGHENKVGRFEWREYVLWDMQKKHKKEVKEAAKASKKVKKD